MRRLPLIALLLVGVSVGCGSGDGGDAGPSTTADDGVVERDRPLTPELEAFLDRVDTGRPFTATYEVLRRAGGVTSEVTVTRTATSTEVTSGTLRVVLPASTDEEAALSDIGIFSTFFAAGPAAAIEGTARRADADDPVFSVRRVLGLELECVEVPVLGTSASAWCLTPEGVFGYVDTPAVQYELTEYEPR